MNNPAFKPDADGKYHWYYELNMFTNPTVFITLCKVFGGITLAIGLFVGLVMGGDFAEKLTFVLKFWLIGLAFMLVLCGISYAIFAAIQGGKYCVVFEMDEKTVRHIQVAKHVEKAQVISALTTLVGAAQGSLTLMGTGILASSRSEMTTKLGIVNKIKVRRRRNVIYLHSGLEWNQIYVYDDNFDDVLEFLLANIPPDAKRKGLKTRA